MGPQIKTTCEVLRGSTAVAGPRTEALVLSAKNSLQAVTFTIHPLALPSPSPSQPPSHPVIRGRITASRGPAFARTRSRGRSTSGGAGLEEGEEKLKMGGEEQLVIFRGYRQKNKTKNKQTNKQKQTGYNS